MEEDIVRHYRNLYGIDFTILRLAWILDASDIVWIFEYETWEGMIIEREHEELARRCSKSKALFVPTHEDGSARIDHIVDAEDAALAVALSVQNPASRGKIFKIAGPASFRYDAVIEDIAYRQSESLRQKDGSLHFGCTSSLWSSTGGLCSA